MTVFSRAQFSYGFYKEKVTGPPGFVQLVVRVRLSCTQTESLTWNDWTPSRFDRLPAGGLCSASLLRSVSLDATYTR